jgi:hypothetical protein
MNNADVAQCPWVWIELPVSPQVTPARCRARLSSVPHLCRLRRVERRGGTFDSEWQLRYP